MKRLLALAFLSISLSAAGTAQTGLRIGAQAPLFSASSIDGTTYGLNDLRGSIVVLTFWSTRCEICRYEFPKVNQIVDKYSGRKVVFLALTMENEEKIAAYTQRNRLASRILPNSFGILLQYADRTRDDRLDMGFPSFFVIDQDGLVQYRGSGLNRTNALDLTIDRLAAK